MATEKDDILDYKKAFKDSRERTRFQGLVAAKIEADRKKKEADAKLEEVKEEILVFMLQSGHDKLGLWDGYRVKVVRGRTAAKVDSRLLLEKGVPLATVQECTIPGSPTEYVQIDTPKEVKS